MYIHHLLSSLYVCTYITYSLAEQQVHKSVCKDAASTQKCVQVHSSKYTKVCVCMYVCMYVCIYTYSLAEQQVVAHAGVREHILW
jgi:hypothetical protein